MKKTVLLLNLLIFLSAVNFAQTSVSGAISSNTTWSLSNSPYNIKGSILVPNGVKLTIEPGVVINFTNDYKILVKGNIISSGSSSSLITFNGNSSQGNNVMIMFKSSNLSNSIITYSKFIGPQKAIQLADESEHNQDTIKNSNTLTITNTNFINASLFTKGYDTNANLKLENSTFDNLEVKGYYPRSEKITFTNCTLNNSLIFSDSYNYGIKFDNSLIKNSSFRIGCCGSNFLIENSIVYNSPFSQTNNYHTTTINKSLIINSAIDLSSGDINLSNSIIAFDSSYTLPKGNNPLGSPTKKGIYARKAKILNSAIYGYKYGEGLSLNTYENFSSTISKSTFANNNINIVISGSNGAFTFDQNNFLKTNKLHRISNRSNRDISAINNYWGTSTESEIQSFIFDSNDDIDKGTVVYKPFASSYYLLAPISPHLMLLKPHLVLVLC